MKKSVLSSIVVCGLFSCATVGGMYSSDDVFLSDSCCERFASRGRGSSATGQPFTNKEILKNNNNNYCESEIVSHSGTELSSEQPTSAKRNLFQSKFARLSRNGSSSKKAVGSILSSNKKGNKETSGKTFCEFMNNERGNAEKAGKKKEDFPSNKEVINEMVNLVRQDIRKKAKTKEEMSKIVGNIQCIINGGSSYYDSADVLLRELDKIVQGQSEDISNVKKKTELAKVCVSLSNKRDKKTGFYYLKKKLINRQSTEADIENEKEIKNRQNENNENLNANNESENVTGSNQSVQKKETKNETSRINSKTEEKSIKSAGSDELTVKSNEKENVKGDGHQLTTDNQTNKRFFKSVRNKYKQRKNS